MTVPNLRLDKCGWSQASFQPEQAWGERREGVKWGQGIDLRKGAELDWRIISSESAYITDIMVMISVFTL